MACPHRTSSSYAGFTLRTGRRVRRQPRRNHRCAASGCPLLMLLALFVLTSIATTPCQSWSATPSTSAATTTTKLPSCCIVTGANGYLGREIVHEILRHLHQDDKKEVTRILCLVRQGRVAQEEEYWKETSDGRLQVLPYDMLDGGVSLRYALEQAQGGRDSQNDDSNGDNEEEICLFHVASCFGPSENPAETALENVEGTRSVVRTLAEFPFAGKKHLILTSSMAAVRGPGQEPVNGKVYTKQDWNTASKHGADFSWGSNYQWSKRQSEQEAWKLVREYHDEGHSNLIMTSLCPSFIFGPSSSPPLPGTTSFSSYSWDFVASWFRGEAPVQSRLCVDVRDVARTQVRVASLRPKTVVAGERYIVSHDARVPSLDMAHSLRQYSSSPDQITADTEFQGGFIPIGQAEVHATERLKQELNIVLRPVQETIAEMGRAFQQEEKSQQGL